MKSLHIECEMVRSAKEENKPGYKGLGKGRGTGRVTHLNRIVRVDVTIKGEFSQTLEGDERASHLDIETNLAA